MDKDWIFILGAQDPEMREIKKAISYAGFRHLHAAKAGVRCNPRTAYAADGVILTGPEHSGRAAVLRPHAPAVLVECNVQGYEPVLRIDHHHPGDPGYDKLPEHYMEALRSGGC